MSRALVVAYLLYFGVARSAIPLYSFGDLLPLPVSFRFFGFFFVIWAPYRGSNPRTR